MLKQIFDDKKESNDLTQKPISKLQETEKDLKNVQDFLEKKIQAEITFARENSVSNKSDALKALQRKREYEKRQQNIDDLLQTIEYHKRTDANAFLDMDNNFGDLIRWGTAESGNEEPLGFEWIELPMENLMGDLARRDTDDYGDEMTDAEVIAELEKIESELEQETDNKTL